MYWEHTIFEAQQTTFNSVFALLINASPYPLRLLKEQLPESLILLASYATVLHKRRSPRVIRDAGRYLLISTVCHFGSHWDPWLSWPKSKIISIEGDIILII